MVGRQGGVFVLVKTRRFSGYSNPMTDCKRQPDQAFTICARRNDYATPERVKKQACRTGRMRLSDRHLNRGRIMLIKKPSSVINQFSSVYTAKLSIIMKTRGNKIGY